MKSLSLLLLLFVAVSFTACLPTKAEPETMKKVIESPSVMEKTMEAESPTEEVMTNDEESSPAVEDAIDDTSDLFGEETEISL